MVKYYSATRNDVILPLATTLMGLENIMLSEIRQTMSGIIRFDSYVGFKTESN